MMDKPSSTGYERAIVIGGSIGGLLAARVLSDHFLEVTIIEREGLAHSAEPRQAIPQGRHVHVLLEQGTRVIKQLFPDLVPALTEAGLTLADTSRDFRWRHFQVWKTRVPTGINIFFLNRPLFEWHVAARVSKIPNINVLQPCEVSGLVASQDGARITGLTIKRPNSTPERLTADLVVDATGRGSQMPQWLKALGLTAPGETTVEVNVGYASRIYRRPAELPDWSGLFVVPKPPDTRGGAVFPIDGNRWLVTLAGWLADYPPTTDAEYLEFAGSLEVPNIRLALEKAEPLTPISLHKFPANRRRHYERLSDLPEGLVVLGDALCSFNPVYAQGMTVAALDAMTLDRCLNQNRQHRLGMAGLGRRFHKQIAAIVDVPWQLAVGEDLRYREAKGRRPFGTAFLHWYVGLIHEATGHDEQVAREFHKVLHLTEPPSLLFHPGVFFRTMVSAFRSQPPSQHPYRRPGLDVAGQTD
jgi:2-polyprenyl-6-methoxyphenol hydroxylase-like FAD-dependent oxidoreductase